MPLKAQSVWNNDDETQSWSDTANWNPAEVPGVAGYNPSVTIDTDSFSSEANPIVVDTGTELGDESVSITSLTFDNTENLALTYASSETLTVTGAIDNTTSAVDEFQLPIVAGASATYTGGSGGLKFQSALYVGSNTIDTTGTISVTGTLGFNIVNSATFGQIDNSGSFSIVSPGSTTVDITTASYTGTAGNTFTFANAGNFTGATIDTPTLSSGLSWNVVNETNGLELMVVPEPGSVGLFLLGLGLLVVAGVHPRLRRRLLPALVRK
jgi:hypothetical protein